VTVRLAAWSGPRNISTALMRSWENRPDTVVVDEPLYSYYLTESGTDHPMREAVIASQCPDLEVVVAELLGPIEGEPSVHYQKHMCHHLLPQADRSWITRLRNVLLIRDPAEVVASYRRSRDTVTPEDIGVPQQVELYDDLVAAGAEPPIIDARDFLTDPEEYLRWLCDWVRVPFAPAMLYWPAGARDSDGAWAPHWYASVWASTGFAPPAPKPGVPAEGADAEVVAVVRPAYELLHAKRLVL
jgi:hypothetical protein